MQQKKRRLLAAAILCILTALILAPGTAQESYAAGAADSLTVSLGYFGGPYYTKKEFSLSEMSAMSQKETYSLVNQLPQVCVDFASGVPVSQILNKAGIDSGSVQRFYLRTYDSGVSYYKDYATETLLGRRYYYPYLAHYYRAGEELDSRAKNGRIPVEAMLAVTDKWIKCVPGDPDAEPEEILSNDYGTSENRFRLLLGQAEPAEQTANSAAKWVYGIEVMLTGSPTLTMDKSALELEVGSTYQAKVSVSAYDSQLEEAIRGDIQWSSSDESVAKVDKNGKVTVVGKGKVQITATYKMQNKTVSASQKVTGTKGAGSGSGDGNGSAGQGAGSGGTQGGSGAGNDEEEGGRSLTLNQGKKPEGKTAQQAADKASDKAGEDGEAGAAKKWTMYEVSQTPEDMQQMPEIEKEDEDRHGGALAGLIGGTVFLLSMAGRAWIFFKQL